MNPISLVPFASFSCQVHVATEVLLNLGARHNQQPQHTRNENTHDMAAGSPNRSGRFLKPIRPLLLDLASRRQGKPVRPTLSRNSPKDQNTSRAFPHLNKRSHSAAETSFLKNPSRQPTGRNWLDRFGKPVGSVLAWTVGKNTARGKNSNLPPIDLQIRSTDQRETLGIVGVPRGLPLARSSIPKTHSIKRNQKSTLKNTSNPRTPKTPKSSPLTRGFGRGIKDKRTKKGSHEFPPSNPQEQGPENTLRKPPRDGSENHHQEQQGTTQQSLGEPRRIIYTYQKGSYKV
jgi:hypothetical protein